MNRCRSHLCTMWVLVVLLMGALLAGCVAMESPSMDEGADAMPVMVPEPGKIMVVNAMSRPSPMAAGNGAAYMVILNGLDTDVQLTSAATEVAAVTELHETVNDNGVMRMQPRPEGFTIPAGGSVELKPGGKHVMMIDLVAPLEPGDEIELTLNFDNGDSMSFTVPVTEMSGEMPAGMDHGDADHGDADHGGMNHGDTESEGEDSEGEESSAGSGD
jgi:copper(I)-binding protein